MIRNKSRFKVLNWGRRSGKTTAFAYEALGTALTVENAVVTYYAQTLGDARDIAWNIFIDVFGGAVVSTNQTLLEIVVKNLKGGTSKVMLKGWESVYQANKGRGTENDLILADEVAFCKQFLEYWDKVLAPTLLTSKGRAVFASTPNGFNDFHRLVQRAEVSQDWWYSHATSYDNPANDPKEIERIKNEISEDRFAQEYLADFRRLEGLVYKEFDRNRHLFDPKEVNITNVIEYIAGVDFGFTNPCAVIHIKKDFDNNYWVVDEFYQRGRTDEQVGDYVLSCKFNAVYPDPENPSAISVLQTKGVNLIEVVKERGSIQTGINKVRNLLKRNKLMISKHCVNLLNELEQYSYPDKKPDHNEDENPVKENDHALDALRYAIMMNMPEDPLEEQQRRSAIHQARRAATINHAR